MALNFYAYLLHKNSVLFSLYQISPRAFTQKIHRNMVTQDKAEVKTTQFPDSSPSLSICWAMT